MWMTALDGQMNGKECIKVRVVMIGDRDRAQVEMTG